MSNPNNPDGADEQNGSAPPPPYGPPPSGPPPSGPLPPPTGPPGAPPPGYYGSNPPPPPGAPPPPGYYGSNPSPPPGPGGFTPPPAQPYAYGGVGGGFSAPGGHMLADSGKRLIARLIDLGILIVVYVIVVVVLVTALVASDLNSFGNDAGFALNGTSIISGVVFWVLYWLYESLMVSSRGQTLGKMIMKIKVVNDVGGPVSTGDAMKRALVWLVILVPCCIGYVAWLVLEIWGLVNIFNSPDRRTPMDQFADTLVIDAS